MLSWERERQTDTQNDLVASKVYLEQNLFLFKKYFIYFFGHRGREGEKEGEKHRCERQTSIICLLYTPEPVTEPTAQACAPARNQTSNLLLCRRTPSQLSDMSQGKTNVFLKLQMETIRLSCRVGDVFPLTEIKKKKPLMKQFNFKSITKILVPKKMWGKRTKKHLAVIWPLVLRPLMLVTN